MTSYTRDGYKPIIAVKKNTIMNSPTNGKLHPLFYADGSLIDNLYDEFPNAGEIFVVSGFDSLPDDLLEIRYEENDPSLGTVSQDAPSYSHYVLKPRPDGLRHVAAPCERFCDVVEWDGFPEFESEMTFPFRLTKNFFVEDENTRRIRGPYKVQDFRQVDSKFWSAKVISAHKTDGICQRLPILREKLLLEFSNQDISQDAIIALAGLQNYDLDYNERTFVDINAVFELAGDNARIVDAMSDAGLLDWGRHTLAAHSTIDKAESRRFRDLILTIREAGSSSMPKRFFQERVDRLAAKLEDISTLQGIISGLEQGILESHAATQEGQEFLDRYIQKRRPKVMEDIRKEMLSTEQRQIDEKRAQAQQELDRMQAIREELTEEVERLKEQSTQERVAVLTDELERLQSEVKEAKQDVIYQERRREELSTENKRLIQNLDSNEEALRSKLAEQKLILDALSGYGQDKNDRRFPSFKIRSTRENRIDKEELVRSVHAFLNSRGRAVTQAETANYIASVVQNRFSIFAGYPGVGKTSLVTLLGQAIGLRPMQDPRRMLKINVGRGWVSSRDLVGVFNPISNKFTPADSGLFQALTTLDEECADGGSKLPFGVLLDEMNLSSVEHYLSDFIAQADEETGEVSFGGRRLRFDRSLRFIGTVNYDETTENLSPRMLSRAPVIYLSPPKVKDIKEIHDTSMLEPPVPVTMKDLEPFWGVNAEFDDDTDEEVKFRHLAEMAEKEEYDGKGLGRPIIIDARAIRSIKRFCNATRDLVSQERGKYGALDFAFAQRVLPRVRGSGSDYRRRLDKLKHICDEARMIESSTILQRIIENGAEYDEYDFFAF